MSAVVVATAVFSAPLVARRTVGQPLQDRFRRHLIGQQRVLIGSAQDRWRAVDAPHLVALVRSGARFERGTLVERDAPVAL